MDSLRGEGRFVESTMGVVLRPRSQQFDCYKIVSILRT